MEISLAKNHPENKNIASNKKPNKSITFEVLFSLSGLYQKYV